MPSVPAWMTSMSGSPNTMNRLPAPVFLSSSSPMARSGFMRVTSTARLAVALGLLGHVRVEGKAADDEEVETEALDGFLGRLADVERARPCRAPGRWRRRRASSSCRHPCTRRAREPRCPRTRSRRSKTSRSCLRVFWTPAFRRLSRIIVSKGTARGERRASVSVAGRSSSVDRKRCGDRLSTVNGPVTRMRFGSSYGLS